MATSVSASCISLPDDILSVIGHSKKKERYTNIDDVPLPPNNEYWKPSTVGTKDGIIHDENIRFSYVGSLYVEFKEYEFSQCVELSKKIHDALIRLYPSTIFDNVITGINKRYDNEKIVDKVEYLAPYLDILKYDRFSRSDNEVECIHDNASIKNILCYTKGGHFKEHTDNNDNLKIATTLIFFPSSNLKGGDLCLRLNDMYDPENIFVKDGDYFRLKVSEIKTPVLVSFHTNVPHKCEEVIEGYRYCVKASQYLPQHYEYFNNTEPTTIPNIKDILYRKNQNDIQYWLEKIQEIRRTILELEQKEKDMLQKITSDTEVDDNTLTSETVELYNKIENNNSDNIMVIMKSGPQNVDYNNSNYSKNVDLESVLSSFDYDEIDFIIAMIRKYPLSRLNVVFGKKKIVGFKDDMDDRDQVEELCQMDHVRRIKILDYDGVNVYYFRDPDYEIIGHVSDYYTEFNDSDAYAGYQYISMYALCIKK